jgi:hypothetical protein
MVIMPYEAQWVNSKAGTNYKPSMKKSQKLNAALSIIFLAIWLPLGFVFLLINSILGYVVSVVLFGFSGYVGYYFYRIWWLHNRGQPLSKEKERRRDQYRRQMRDYQHYNMYNRLYRFGDVTELEYQAEKAEKELNKNH